MVRKWIHYLSPQLFTLITDQRSVVFMFSNEKRTKIKNAKIQEWRLELSAFDYIMKKNEVPDALSEAYSFFDHQYSCPHSQWTMPPGNYNIRPGTHRLNNLTTLYGR